MIIIEMDVFGLIIALSTCDNAIKFSIVLARAGYLRKYVMDSKW